MSTWVSESELASRLGYKILIAGLSEAGKTAVKRIFFMKQQTGDVNRLSATINYERIAVSIKGVPVTVVDLGGQRVFIRRFLSNFSPFVFSTVQVFIFVIDVAEKSTRNNSIQYFASCIEKLKQYSPEAYIFVFLHKNDLVINLPNYESIHSQLKEQFQLECPNKISFLRTTIYRPETVIDAFGRIFELAMSRIAQSEYVDGRSIGRVEEYAEKYVTTVEESFEVCPQCGSQFVQDGSLLRCNFCGHKQPLKVAGVVPAAAPVGDGDPGSTTLEKLKSLMEESLITDDTAEEVSPSPTTSRIDGDSVTLDNLKSLVQKSLIEGAVASKPSGLERPVTAVMDDDNGSTTLEELKSLMQDSITEPGPVEPSIRAPIQPAAGIASSEAAVSVFQVSHLTEFYGIGTEDAEKLVESGHASIFETAAKSGVPVNLLLEVFFKHLPYLEKKGLNISNLETRLLEVFFAHLNGLVREEEVFNCLIFAAQRPNVSIEEIVKKYLVKMREEKAGKQPIRVRPKPVKPKVEMVKPVKTAVNQILLSRSENISFTAEKQDVNCLLTFYKDNQRLSSNLVPTNISTRELQYLLVFEAEIEIEDYRDFVASAVPIIHGTIVKLFELEKKVDTISPVPVTTPRRKTADTSPVPVTTPRRKTADTSPVSPTTSEETVEMVETLPRTSLLKLFQDKDIFYKIVINNQIFEITFVKDNNRIGLVNIPLSVTVPQLMESIRVSLPEQLRQVLSEDDMTYAAKNVYIAAQDLRKKVVPIVKEKPAQITGTYIIPEKKTSILLKEYLRKFDEKFIED
ncbi:MAG: ADP-ribosylation factor-like protein [Candidatus Odinarchaeota archaeon]